jgi:hypothetical protein
MEAMSDRNQRSREVPEDPSGIDEPHDVLAAEEFGIGTRDERHPPDPSGIQEPHDVLAAEEFAMPSPGDRAEPESRSPDMRAWLPLAVLAALVVLLAALRRRG